MKLIAKTPVGTFTSVEESSFEEYELLKLLKESGTYLSFRTEEGVVVFKSEILKNTVFIVQD